MLAILYPLRQSNVSSSPSRNDLPEYSVILTQRSSTLRVSPSVSAFPGGKVDDVDNEDEWTTAFREAKEEIGFDVLQYPPGAVKKVAISPCYLSLGNDAVRLCACVVESIPQSVIQKLGLDAGGARDLSYDFPTVPEYMDHDNGAKLQPNDVNGSVYGPPFLKALAPSVSFAEVALVYSVPLRSLLNHTAWYIDGTPMTVSGVPWIFHEYLINMQETIGMLKAVPDGLPEYQFTDKEGEEEQKQEQDKLVQKNKDKKSDTPPQLKYQPTDSQIQLHGLTAHMALDLARACYPDTKLKFDALPYLGSDIIVQKYYNSKYVNSSSM